MGNCLCVSDTDISKKRKNTPIETAFKLPSPTPTWPPGEKEAFRSPIFDKDNDSFDFEPSVRCTGFANGKIDLGGLEVCQVTSLNKVWATHEGGPDNLGATFFEPSVLPEGFFMLGCYSQPNNKPLHGWVLAAKDLTNNPPNGHLKQPADYTLVWSSESLKIKQDGIGYVWVPVPPDGYKAIGHVITNSPNKPPLDKVRCVRSDFTDQCETNTWIWGPGKTSDPSGFNIYSLRPTVRGAQALGVSVGTFVAQSGSASPISITCLKNNNTSYASFMPNLNQIEALVQAYSPWVYFHPDETYLPSSVNWFFSNGALLYKKGEEPNPSPIEPNGANLPQGGSDDGAYWLDLPKDEAAKERVKKGDLQSSQVYLHVKPALGATFTDIAIWIFYPFNGGARAKVEFVNISLGKIGEHVGDWEHVTLRISNFNGELWSVYFSEHSGGIWADASELEFQNGNKPVTYASLHGHAMYPKPGLVLQGSGNIGIRNDTAKSKIFMDTGGASLLVTVDHLGAAIVSPPWLDYYRKWGPKITYDIGKEIEKVEKLLPGKLKSAFDKIIRSLPSEVLGEDGPTGPKVKSNWVGDETT